MTEEWAGFEVEDEESFRDFHDALNDYSPHIEALVASLRQQPDDGDAIADLFRTFHNIKGDASLCRLHVLVPFVHAVEALLSRVRNREATFSIHLADVVLLCTDRLQQAVEAMASKSSFENLHLLGLTRDIEVMLPLAGSELDAACQKLIDALAGTLPNLEDEAVAEESFLLADRTGHLCFFRQLALQFECRSSLFAGRAERNLKLALLTSRIGAGEVDAEQLCAAVYMHDLGMMLLPEALWLGPKALSPDERALMKQHVAWGAGLLQRMPGWEQAAQIVLQHHEKPDGSGYPHGLHGDEIHDGAKILALVDAFEAVVVKQGARGQPRSILRAAAEVNAADTQFDKRWVDAFNRAVRHVVEERG